MIAYSSKFFCNAGLKLYTMSKERVILGAHMSMAGGFDKAIERGHEIGCECVQLFTKNNNQWRANDLRESDLPALERAKSRCDISHVIAHGSYLINLASPDDQLWKKSLDAFVNELRRAEQLSIPYLVLHPGAYTFGSEERGLRRIVRALNEAHRRTRKLTAKCLLENTAGQGTCLGYRFEHLAAILDRVKSPERLGICFDTCHAFAAGYPMETEREYLNTVGQIDQLVGLDQIKAIHLNDSKRHLGSRIDRHEHIGDGCMGTKPFARLLGDHRLRHIPMYLETPKGENRVEHTSWDSVNLSRLRDLVAAADG